MPFTMPNFPILTPEQANPFNAALKQAFQTYHQGLQSAFEKPTLEQALLKAQQENEWNPKIWESQINQRNAQTGLLGQQSKYYGQNIQSEMASRNVETELNKLKLKYPGLGQGGIVGELAYANLIQDNPEVANRLSKINEQQNPSIQQNQVASPAPSNELNIPGYGGMSAVPNNALVQSMIPVIARNNQMQQKLPQQQPNNRPNDPASLLMQNIQSEISARNALANQRFGGVGSMKYAPAVQKNINAFTQQLAADHPNWDIDKVKEAQSSYLLGSDEFDGEKLSGNANALRSAIFKNNSTVQIQNQAATMDATAKELNAIDIKPLQAFSGLKGKINVLKYKADMASGKPVPQEFRDYLSFQDILSYFAQDTLRKGFATSVVPDYVSLTLGKASNPGSAWWSDPKQVQNDWSKTLGWINKNAQIYKIKAQQGATAEPRQSTRKKPSEMSTAEIEAELAQYGGSNG